jgi:hypothetical protein
MRRDGVAAGQPEKGRDELRSAITHYRQTLRHGHGELRGDLFADGREQHPETRGKISTFCPFRALIAL